MELYKKEFSAEFLLGFELKQFDYLIDKSWHNDLCPSFYFSIGSQFFILWVDYPLDEEREENTQRYTIVKASNEGCTEFPELYSVDEVLFEDNSAEELRKYLSRVK